MEYWVFPTNVKHFDIVNHFKNHSTVIWKYYANVRLNDVVYIYVGNPYKTILYKCIVTKINIDTDTVEKNKYAITKNATDKTKYLEMKLDKTFDKDTMPCFNILKNNGLGQVQKQARASRAFLFFIKQFE